MRRDRVAVQRLAVRAMQVARSVGRASRRGAKGGVRVDDPKQLLCIRPAIETFADEPPSLVLLVHNGVSYPLTNARAVARVRYGGRAGLNPRTGLSPTRWCRELGWLYCGDLIDDLAPPSGAAVDSGVVGRRFRARSS